MVQKEQMPAEFRISRKGKWWPWRVRARNPRTGRWHVMASFGDSREDAEAYVAAMKQAHVNKVEVQ